MWLIKAFSSFIGYWLTLNHVCVYVCVAICRPFSNHPPTQHTHTHSRPLCLRIGRGHHISSVWCWNGQRRALRLDATRSPHTHCACYFRSIMVTQQECYSKCPLTVQVFLLRRHHLVRGCFTHSPSHVRAGELVLRGSDAIRQRLARHVFLFFFLTNPFRTKEWTGGART